MNEHLNNLKVYGTVGNLAVCADKVTHNVVIVDVNNSNTVLELPPDVVDEFLSNLKLLGKEIYGFDIDTDLFRIRVRENQWGRIEISQEIKPTNQQQVL